VVIRLMDGRLAWSKIVGGILMFLAIVLGILISSLPVIDHYKQNIIASNLIKDQVAVESMKANVAWSGFEWLIGMGLIIGTAAMLVLIHKKKIQAGLIGTFLVSLLTANIAITLIVPRIEQYSQGAAIRFYESLKGRDCYVATLRFKSYAQFFYQGKEPPENKESYDLDWLLTGAIDKPAYFVCKIDKIGEVSNQYPQLKQLYGENGFVFLVRYPSGH
ncbi:MAG TPA: hypothetical protein VFP87_12030, partial [Chitinophagaceae bacterium]|nr:hypothetical protein [Chitinophagaceae bacterium]